MSSNSVTTELSPVDLKNKLDAGEKPFILDVRETHEVKICQLANSANIPLGDLLVRMNELEKYKSEEIVVYCRSGKRSAMAASFLKEHGYQRVINLAGGILAWSDQVDSSVQKY